MLANCSVFHAFLENVDFGEVAAAASEELAVTVEGAQVGDLVLYSARQANATAVCYGIGRVSAADTVQLRITNASAGALTPPATNDYDIYLIRATGALSTAVVV